MNRAVFLDRDGVINQNVFNNATQEWESPHSPADFKLFPWTIESLLRLQEHQFQLFLVSNQPSFAKGKTSLENIKAIQAEFHSILLKNKIYFKEYYYCYHHPHGIVPELSIQCDCRKPGAFFLNEAKRKYSLDMSNSWMAGDRGSDILCGQKAGVKTLLIINEEERSKKLQDVVPDFKVKNLQEAVNIIIR